MAQRLFGLEQCRGERRRQDQRNDHGEHHGGDDGDRKLAIDDARRAAEKRHRQEHRRQDKCDGNQRDVDFLHRLDGRIARRHARIFLHQPLDIFDDDYRVIDQQPDRQHQPEQSERVDRKAERGKHRESAQQHHRHRDCRDQRRAPALQEHEHHDHHQHDCLGERLHHFLDRQLDELGRVRRIGDGKTRRHRFGELGNLGLHPFRRGERVGAGGQRHRKAGAGVAIGAAADRVVLRAQLDARDILQPHDRSIGRGAQDDVGEFLCGRQPRLGGDGRVQHLRRRAGLAAQFAGGNLDILGLDRLDHVAGDQVVGRQLIGLQPDAHGILRAEHVGVAHAFQPADRVLQIADQIVRHVLVGAAVGGVIDRKDHQEIGAGFGDGKPLLLHRAGQPWQRLLHAVLHLDLGNVRVDALFEGRRNRHLPARAGGGAEIEQPVNAGQLLLDDLRHAVFKDFGRGTGVIGADVHLRRRDIGILLDRQRHQTAGAQQHDEDRHDPGEDRPIDENA